MALVKMPKIDTCLFCSVTCYDAKIEDKYQGKVELGVFAINEAEALEKAKKILKRKHYEVYNITEIVDSYKKD